MEEGSKGRREGGRDEKQRKETLRVGGLAYDSVFDCLSITCKALRLISRPSDKGN